MTINKEQIEKTLKEYLKDYPAQQVGIDCSILAQRIAEDYQPKTASTDIEELKKEFEDRFTQPTNTADKHLVIFKDGDTAIKADDVWNFFAPHLSNKSELKKEAVRNYNEELSTLKVGDTITFDEDNQLRYGQDFGFYRDVPANVEFTVTSLGDKSVQLRAKGYGETGAYGNGCIYVYLSSNEKEEE